MLSSFIPSEGKETIVTEMRGMVGYELMATLGQNKGLIIRDEGRKKRFGRRKVEESEEQELVGF
jgi:hypothetical protein